MNGRPARLASWATSLVLVAGVTASFLSGCAGRRPVVRALELTTAKGRYEQTLARREQAAASALLDLEARVEGRATGRLPRFELRAAMQAPDRVRLRASWLLGTAFDLCALGDSVQAVVPSRHRGIVVGGDSPIGPPAARFLTALLALWRPDSSAWSTLRADSAGASLRWLDSGDTLRLSLDADARPTALAWRTGTGPTVTARYVGWQSVDGAEIPQRVILEDDRGAMRAQFELSGFEPRPAGDPEWFALRLPERTERVAWNELGQWLVNAADRW